MNTLLNNGLILDSNGAIVFYQNFPSSPGSIDFKIQPNGLMSYSANNKFYLMDSSFHLVDSISTQNGFYTDTHELQILPNGHYLLLGYEVVTMDLSGYKLFNNGKSTGSPTAMVKANVIQELDKDKKVVWEWHAKDHFSFDSVDPFWLKAFDNVDWTHSNALEMDDDGNILLSSRHFNEITKINHTDGSIMWRLGGKYNQFTFLNDSLPFYGQHDIRRIDNGHITLYDDANYYDPHGARAVEYELDEVNKTAKLVWSYTYDTGMYSNATGSVQRLPNGNTVIDYGMLNKNVVCFIVVDPNGNQVFNLKYGDNSFSYRVFNYFSLPWSIPRPQISCFDSMGVQYLDAGPGYSTYKWSNGRKTRKIPVLAKGTYTVSMPYGVGFLVSAPLVITDVNDPCGLNASLSQTAKAENGIMIYPNPVRDRLTIDLDSKATDPKNIEIYDISGKRMPVTCNDISSFQSNHIALDVSSFKPGLYVIRMNGTVGRFVKE
jgi:hypothetical protein